MKKEQDKTLHDFIKEAIDSDKDFFSDFEGMGPSDQKVPDDFRELVTSAYKQKPNKRPHRILKASALILAFFCCSSIMAVFISEHNTVQAIKFRLEQFVWTINGNLVTTEETADGNGRIEMIMEISDWEDIDQAKKFLKELYIPTYIPEGYEFQLLKINKSLDIPYYSEYLYLNEQNKSLIIYQEHSSQINTEIFSVENIYKTQECALGDLYFTYNDVFNLYYGTIITKNEVINISGNVSEDEILTIIEGLEQREKE